MEIVNSKKSRYLDLLRNYREFKEDIEFGFSDLIKEYQLQLTYPTEGLYLLLAENCSLKFTYDRGDVSCCFLQPSESYYNYGNHVSVVYRYLHPDKTINFDGQNMLDRKVQIKIYAYLINNGLLNVLNGDFSWLPEFTKEKDGEDKIFLYLLGNINYNHPIKIKFWAGDLTWRSDLEQYLKHNSIKL